MNIIEVIGPGGHFQQHANFNPNNTPQPAGLPKLTEEEAFGNKQCANCGRGGSNSWCHGCQVSEVGQMRVFYCGKDCQKAHWPSHKDTCKARRQLGRSVSITEEMWTTFETATLSSPARFLEKKGNIIVMEVQQDDLRLRGMKGDSLFKRVPDDICPKNTDEEIIKAMIFSSNCAEVMATGMPLVNLLLQRKS